MNSYILHFSCEDRPGLVAAVTTMIAEQKGNITSAQQFNDALSSRFFMRVQFDMEEAQEFQDRFKQKADDLGLNWRLRNSRDRKRVVILVSKFDHCLLDLLYRARLGELDMEIAAIISNHPRDTLKISNLHGADFHYLPISKETKIHQEEALKDILEGLDPDLVILARYMQILSDDMVGYLKGRCVNIHHSFLPGFKGARPYHQAYKRGVKMIGATAHFVTADLDEGPIIAQNVEAITHRDDAEDLVSKGRAIEQRVLASAVKALIEDRVFLNGDRTVVFE